MPKYLYNTDNEVIKAVKEYFSKPGAQLSKGENGFGFNCFYRLNEDPCNSVRCAVGVLIPDDVYTPDWEGLPANEIYDDLCDANVLGPNVHPMLLNELQAAHDDATDVADFLDRLNRV